MPKHLTYANVASTLALVGVVAGGGAYAASKIGTQQIKAGAVTAPKLADEAVKSAKLRGGAVGTEKLAREADGVALAGVNVDMWGIPITYFNRAGNDAKPRVEASPGGVYSIYFPGLEDFNFGRALQSATLVGTTGAITVDSTICSGYCPPHVVVRTFDPSGAPAPRAFSYVLFDASPPGYPPSIRTK